MAIEIRLIDLQESPQADISRLRQRSSKPFTRCSRKPGPGKQQQWNEIPLAAILAGIQDADQAIITQRSYLDLFGFPEKGPTRVHELWQYLIETLLFQESSFRRMATHPGNLHPRGLPC